jgi:hypothetical protein
MDFRKQLELYATVMLSIGNIKLNFTENNGSHKAIIRKKNSMKKTLNMQKTV